MAVSKTHPFTDRRILVTGAAGFMGKIMVRLLAEQGAVVLATDIVPKAPEEFLRLPAVAYVACDLTDPGDIAKRLIFWMGYHYVFHIAGTSDRASSHATFQKVNVEGSRNLIRGLRDCDTLPLRLVFWSDGGMYDFPRGKRGKIMKETSPIAENLRDYLKSKRDAETMLLKEGAECDIPVTSIRPGLVYGPGCRGGAATVLKIAIHGGLRLFSVGSSATRIGTIHAEDVCRAATFVALRPQANGQIYNVSDGSAHTAASLMHACSAHFGCPRFPGVTMPSWIARLLMRHTSDLTEDMRDVWERDTLLDARKLRELGWTPKHPDPLKSDGGMFAV